MYITPPYTESVTAIALEAIRNRVFPGVLVGVYCSGKWFKAVSIGNFTYDVASKPVDDSTLYDMASVTKIFITALTLRFIGVNLIDIDALVQSILPNSLLPGVTIRHLLSHTGGLHLSLSKLKEFEAPEIEKIILNTPPMLKPGSQYYYSNQGFYIFGKVVETVLKKPLDIVLRENLSTVVGMNNTMYNPPRCLHNIPPTEDDEWRNGVIAGECHDEIAIKVGGVAGHAGLFASVYDSVRLGTLWLPAGNYSENYIVSDLRNDSLVPAFHDALDDKGNAMPTFGYGWRIVGRSFIGELASQKSVYFSGFTGPSIMVDPINHIVIAILNNRIYPKRDGPDRSTYHARITDEIYRGIMI